MSLEDRVERLEAREEIKELCANYCHGVDKREEGTFLDIWAEGATYNIRDPWNVECEGEDAIRGVLHQVWAALPESHHHTTNNVIEVNGDTATGVSDVNCTGTDSAGNAMLIAATYRDEYERTDDGWKITFRDAEIYYMTPVDDPWSEDPEDRMKFAPPEE